MKEKEELTLFLPPVSRQGRESLPHHALKAFLGSHVGGCLVEEEIGWGPRGIVYRGTQVSLGREVAIKVFPHSHASDPETAVRFVREAQILAKLNHPNLVRIYDAGQQEGVLYFVMEYVPGPTIRSLLTLDGKLPHHLAAEYIAQAAEALDVAYHETHVIHRNLTATNLMLDWGGRLKVMDFGVARVPGLPPITTASTLIGSLASASPEYLQGRPLDHRSDVYALGVVLYEMLTGTLPFGGHTPQEVAQAILAGQLLAPTRMLPDLLPELEQILLIALAANPDARFAEAGLMAKALRSLPLSVPSAKAPGALREQHPPLPAQPTEGASRRLPKPLALPIRDPHTPVPGLLTPFSETDRHPSATSRLIHRSPNERET